MGFFFSISSSTIIWVHPKHYENNPGIFTTSLTSRLQANVLKQGGLMKHLIAAHPGYLNVHPYPLPSNPTSPVCKKPKKKHHRYQFSFTGGFSLSFDSVDLATPTDHDCITDSEDSRSTNPTLFSPVSPKCPYIEDLWDEDVDHNHIPTSPIPSPCPESPSSPAFTI